jgi:hypothetical protein
MILKIDKPLNIDNLKGYPASVIQQLEELLNSGVEARVDPKRKNYYDVYVAEREFFIYADPACRKVMLLATWSTRSSVPVMAM